MILRYFSSINNENPVFIWTNTDSVDIAEAIARECVRAGVCAAVNTDKIISHYMWEGVVHRKEEHRLCIKTLASAAPKVVEVIRTLHSYQEPSIVVTPVMGGSASYLSWVEQCVEQGEG